LWYPLQSEIREIEEQKVKFENKKSETTEKEMSSREEVLFLPADSA
jgi:hypothetical protein